MWFRRLVLLAACASLLGWAAAHLVGPHLPDLLSALSRTTSSGKSMETSVAQADGPTCDAGADGGAPSEVEAERIAAGTAPDPPPAAGPRRSRHKTHVAAGDRLADQLARGVRKLGGRRYEIKRGALELALRNLRLLSAWVRVAPDVRHGKPCGFRVVAVMPTGPFAKLGLRRNDVLVSVNGLDIRTPDGALDAYGKLKSTSRFALGFLRDGREMVQEYRIR